MLEKVVAPRSVPQHLGCIILLLTSSVKSMTLSYKRLGRHVGETTGRCQACGIQGSIVVLALSRVTVALRKASPSCTLYGGSFIHFMHFLASGPLLFSFHQCSLRMTFARLYFVLQEDHCSSSDMPTEATVVLAAMSSGSLL